MEYLVRNLLVGLSKVHFVMHSGSVNCTKIDEVANLAETLLNRTSSEKVGGFQGVGRPR